jgi:hypothetical protein
LFAFCNCRSLEEIKEEENIVKINPKQADQTLKNKVVVSGMILEHNAFGRK